MLPGQKALQAALACRAQTFWISATLLRQACAEELLAIRRRGVNDRAAGQVGCDGGPRGWIAQLRGGFQHAPVGDLRVVAAESNAEERPVHRGEIDEVVVHRALP